MKRTLLICLLIGFVFAVNAQQEQIFKPVILQLENGKDINTYVMESFSYSISQSMKDSTGVIIPQLQLSLSLQTVPDKFLLEWLTSTGSTKSGKIVYRNIKSGEVLRTFTITDAVILSWSESGSEYSFRESYNGNIYMEVKCKGFAIDGHSLTNFKSYYDD